MNDQQLHDLLTRSAPTIDVDYDQLTTAAIQGGLRRRRRVRLRAAGAGIAAVGVIAAVVIAAPFGSSPDTTTTDRHGVTTAPPTTFEWAEGLPRGGTAQVAYPVPHGVVVGDDLIRLPAGTSVSLVQAIRGGWLAVEQAPDVTLAGILRTDGSFEQLAVESTGDVSSFAMAPAGDMLVLDGNILDTTSWQRIGRVPADAREVQLWTVAGLAYGDASGVTWLWNPGSAPHRIGRWTFRSPSIAIDHTGYGCTSVGRLYKSGELLTFDKACGSDQSDIIGVSPDGSYTIRADGSVVDTAVGSTVGQLPLAVIGVGPASGCCRYVWENDAGLIVSVADGRVPNFNQVLLVRCTVSGSCERASEKLDSLPNALPLLPGS